MVAKSRVGGWLAVLVLVLLPAGLQFQNLFWSTARVENHSGRPLSAVELLVDDAQVGLGDMAPNAARFVRLPKRGDATFRVRFSVGTASFTQCSEYVEDQMYHVRVMIESNLMADCRAEMPLFFERNMLSEMLR